MHFRRRRAQKIDAKPDTAEPVPSAAAPKREAVALFLANRIEEGTIDTGGMRVSDVLKTANAIIIQVATANGEADWMRYQADEIVAVAVPPAPLSPKRVSRRRHKVTINAGRYSITGEAHMPPGADPVRYIDNTSMRWLPLTACTVSHDGDAWQVDVLIVNTDHVRRTSAQGGL